MNRGEVWSASGEAVTVTRPRFGDNQDEWLLGQEPFFFGCSAVRESRRAKIARGSLVALMRNPCTAGSTTKLYIHTHLLHTCIYCYVYSRYIDICAYVKEQRRKGRVLRPSSSSFSFSLQTVYIHRAPLRTFRARHYIH